MVFHQYSIVSNMNERRTSWLLSGGVDEVAAHEEDKNQMDFDDDEDDDDTNEVAAGTRRQVTDLHQLCAGCYRRWL